MVPIVAKIKSEKTHPERGPAAKNNGSLAVYRRIVFFFILLTAGIVALAVYVVFSSAKVVVMSKQEPVEAEFIADVAKNGTDGEVPGGIFAVTDTLSREFASTSLGSMVTSAEGRVRITSKWSRPLHLIATTRLLTEKNVLFRLKKDVLVPALGHVEADVFAAEQGESGDVGAAKFTIPGLAPELQAKFTVETVQPISGGRRDIRVVTAVVVDRAAADLKKDLTVKLTAQLEQSAATEGVPTDGKIITTVNVSRESSVAVGEESKNFTLTLTTKAIGVFYDQNRLHMLIENKLKDKLPAGRRLVSADDSELDVSLEKGDLAAGRANLRVVAKGMSSLSSEAEFLAPEKLTGITVDAAKKYLEKLDGVASASVNVKPFWSGRLPNLAKNITVEVR